MIRLSTDWKHSYSKRNRTGIPKVVQSKGELQEPVTMYMACPLRTVTSKTLLRRYLRSTRSSKVGMRWKQSARCEGIMKKRRNQRSNLESHLLKTQPPKKEQSQQTSNFTRAIQATTTTRVKKLADTK